MKIEEMERIKKLREILNSEDEISEDEIIAYCVQIETLLPPPTKTLYIDADSLIYYAAYAPIEDDSVESKPGSFVSNNKVEIDDLSEAIFYGKVDDVVKACRLEATKGNMIRFNNHQLVFTPSRNFRYDIFPMYKHSRTLKERSEKEIKLKELVKPKGLIVENVEADDVVSYFAKRGHPIASGDKDVIYGVPGNNYYYHSHHKKVVKTSKEDANKFLLLQSIMGDSIDDIKGIKGVGIKTAEKLLGDEHTFDKVISIYESSYECMGCNNIFHVSKLKDPECDGDVFATCPDCKESRVFIQCTKDDAILTRRLVGLDQWKGFRRNKVRLFDYDKI